MQRKEDTIIYVVQFKVYMHEQRIEDNFTNKWELQN